jgi:aldehyde:ferredoxin oxidoreductase
VDLETRSVQAAYTPRHILQTLLSGRGANMFYLYRLLDETLYPLHPEIPLIFGSGVLTGIVPSAARGNCTSWAPESGVILDSNCGDYFPSFLRMNGIDHLVFYGHSRQWTVMVIREGEIEWRDARHMLGLDNIDMRERIAADLGGVWTRDMSMVNVTRAGENGVSRRHHGWPEGDLRARRHRREDGLAWLKGHRDARPHTRVPDAAAVQAVQPRDRAETARDLSREACAVARGTPFPLRPSRLLGAMGTRNNQETTWTDALDAEHIDPYRPGMEGCFRCPVNCRPQNDLMAILRSLRPRRRTEYVTLGKFGPNLGIDDVRAVIRLNNICNDLGFDTGIDRLGHRAGRSNSFSAAIITTATRRDSSFAGATLS